MKNCLMFFLMMFSINAFAEVHRWVDENNRVHYSDLPPSVDAKTKKLRSTSDTKASTNAGGETASSSPAAPKTIAEREAELKKAQLEKKEAADKAAQKQARSEAGKANCAAAQQNLRTLESGIRIPMPNASGETTYMDDEQRQQRIEKTRQDVSKYCQ